MQEALDAAGVTTRIVEYEVPARTSAEAAAVLGCTVGQIAKSLVFKSASGAPVLVIASGAHRVDEAKVATLAGEAHRQGRRLVRPHRDRLCDRRHSAARRTDRRSRTFIDRNLLAYETVYAAGGTPHAMFPIAPAELVRVAEGTVADTAP